MSTLTSKSFYGLSLSRDSRIAEIPPDENTGSHMWENSRFSYVGKIPDIGSHMWGKSRFSYVGKIPVLICGNSRFSYVGIPGSHMWEKSRLSSRGGQLHRGRESEADSYTGGESRRRIATPGARVGSFGGTRTATPVRRIILLVASVIDVFMFLTSVVFCFS